MKPFLPPVARKRRTSRNRKRKIDRHSCELATGSESFLPKIPPNAKCTARARRSFQKLILVSARNPMTRYSFRSHAAMAFEKKKHGHSPNWWVIHPCSNFRFAWDVMMSFIYVYSFLAIPYITAFHILPSAEYTTAEASLLPVFAIYGVDIFLNFVTGYTVKNSHEIFIDPVLIVRNYAGGLFVVDLLSSIPYSWFLANYHSMPGPHSSFPTIIAELLPIIKLFRMATLKKSVKMITLVRAIGVSHTPTVFLWLFMQTIFIYHCSACLCFGLPFVALHARRLRVGDPSEPTWFNKHNLVEASTEKKYLMSLHLGISNLWGSTFQNTIPGTGTEKIMRTVLLIFGTGYLIYLIVIVLHHVESQITPDTKYQQMMNQLREYINEKRLPKALGGRLIEFYKYRFQGSYYKEQAIMSVMPDHLKLEIMMHTCRGLLENVSLFYNLPRSLVSRIVATLKPDIYLQDDVVFICDSPGDCMYFIISGTVSVVTFSGKEICHLDDSGFFGESVLVRSNRRRIVSVIAVEVSELYRFDRSDFKRLVLPGSELFIRLTKVSDGRASVVAQMEDHIRKSLGASAEVFKDAEA